MPFGLDDWPNPPGPRAAIDLRTWLGSVQLNLNGTALPGPTNYDWPNPRGATPGIALRTYIQASPFWLVQPFGQTEWPVPVLRTVQRPWHTEGLKLNLLSQDSVYGDPGQVPTYDWQNPTLRIVTRPAQTDGLKLLLLNQDRMLGAPGEVRTYDWQNPTLRVVQRPWQTDGLKLELRGKDTFFGEAGQPPANLDWPVPQGRPQFNALFAWIEAVNLALTAASPTPFAQTDWPNQLRRPDTRPGQESRARLDLSGQDTFFGLAGSPTYDWPVPRGATPAIELRTWLNQLRLNLLAPFLPFDWPVPRAAQRATPHWITGLPETLRTPPAKPGAFYDWPVPPRRRAEPGWLWRIEGIRPAPPPPVPAFRGRLLISAGFDLSVATGIGLVFLRPDGTSFHDSPANMVLGTANVYTVDQVFEAGSYIIYTFADTDVTLAGTFRVKMIVSMPPPLIEPDIEEGSFEVVLLPKTDIELDSRNVPVPFPPVSPDQLSIRNVVANLPLAVWQGL